MTRSTSSPLSSFVFPGMLLLAALPLFVAAAPARFAHGHHVGHHSALQAAQHGSYLSKRLVSARQEPSDQNCTETDTDTDTDTDGGLVEVEAVASGWYAGWDNNFTVADIPWQQYSQLTFAFAIPTDNGTLSLDGQEEKLREFSMAARAHTVDPYVSLGGYLGSRFFSPAVATPENRTAFVKEIVKMATEYDLAGIDFDWEYPNGGGLECNMKSPDDTANFLAFLRELKQDPVGKTLSVTAATHITPFRDATGAPSKDVSAFAEVFDQLAIMGYDIHGPWSEEVGANAPLRAECPAGRDGSVTTAVDAWVAAGFPAKKLILAVASYGRAFHPTSDVLDKATGLISTLNPPHDTNSIPFGENEDEKTVFPADACGTPGRPSGTFTFNALITSGLLTSEGSPLPNIAYTYDNCTETPFLYDATTNIMISYDDTRSMAAKGAFIVERNMLGFSMWHVAGDSRSNLLTNALWESIGIVPKTPEGAGETPQEATGAEHQY